MECIYKELAWWHPTSQLRPFRFSPRCNVLPPKRFLLVVSLVSLRLLPSLSALQLLSLCLSFCHLRLLPQLSCFQPRPVPPRKQQFLLSRNGRFEDHPKKIRIKGIASFFHVLRRFSSYSSAANFNLW